MCGVAFLPVEFSAPQEGLGVFEFPSNYGIPQIAPVGEVAMTPYPFGVVGIYDGFRGRTYGDLVVELLVSSRDLSACSQLFVLDAGAGTYASVTQATSAAKPSIWFFSRSRASSDTNMGNEQFRTPMLRIFLLNQV